MGAALILRFIAETYCYNIEMIDQTQISVLFVYLRLLPIKQRAKSDST